MGRFGYRTSKDFCDWADKEEKLVWVKIKG